ncbi:uncharacterized protein METZ01_LOCUS26846 [marine metagenome]|uniref:Uncharacterized protein n=1 Tax=marine metagenome TaxID=408172 RepID=A0A381Q3U2_9ZZZZ
MTTYIEAQVDNKHASELRTNFNT